MTRYTAADICQRISIHKLYTPYIMTTVPNAWHGITINMDNSHYTKFVNTQQDNNLGDKYVQNYYEI